jgi:ComF family protein
MKHYWAKLFEIIFPKTDDEIRITSVTEEMFTKIYSINRSNDVTALASFGEKKVRAAIHLNKFHAHSHACTLLSAMLSMHLHTLPKQVYLLIPIPLSSKREQERGYNQVTRVARHTLQSFPHITLASNVLKKQKHTKPQTSLSKKERLENLHGAFCISKSQQAVIAGAHIILLDDVTTTGTTLREAKASLLQHHPASVLCIALAH